MKPFVSQALRRKSEKVKGLFENKALLTLFPVSSRMKARNSIQQENQRCNQAFLSHAE